MRIAFTFILAGFTFSHISAQALSNGGFEGSPQAYTAMEQMPDAPDATVFPNPASSKLYFEVSDVMAGNHVRIYSMLGNEVMNYELIGSHNELSISTLPVGVYIYNIIGKNDKTILAGRFNKK
jgi:hypothetical protein